MIKNLTFFSFVLFLCFSVNAQDVLGKWENRNEEGKVNSIIEVYRQDDKIYGRVEKIIKEEDRERLCTNCEGELKNQPLQGLVIMQGLEKDGNVYEGGTIVDPKTGKEYRCKIWIDDAKPDVLNIRGYLAFFYKTKTWERAE